MLVQEVSLVGLVSFGKIIAKRRNIREMGEKENLSVGIVYNLTSCGQILTIAFILDNSFKNCLWNMTV